MQILSYILTVCAAALLGVNTNVEAKSHKKEHKEKHRQEKAERREQRHKEKEERKLQDKKEAEHKVNDFEPFPIEQIPKVQPVIVETPVSVPIGQGHHPE